MASRLGRDTAADLVRLTSPHLTSLQDVYTEFLRAEGREIFMADPAKYAPIGEEVTFATLYTRARKHDEVCMGYLRAADARPVLNPDMGTCVKLGSGDKLVMLGEAY